ALAPAPSAGRASGGDSAPEARSASDAFTLVGASGAVSASGAGASEAVSSCGVSGSSAMYLNSSFTRDGQRACHLTFGLLQSRRVIQLACRVLEAQPENLAARGTNVLAEIGLEHVAQLCGLHHPSSRR